MGALLTRLVDWRRELLYASVAALEAAWMAPWLALVLALVSGPAYRISMVSAFALVWVGSTVMRILDHMELDLTRERLIMIGCGLLAVLLVIRWEMYAAYAPFSLGWIPALVKEVTSVWLAIPPQILALFLGLFTWMRGIGLGQDALGSTRVGFRFRGGILGIMLYQAVAAMGGESSRVELVLIYFVAGLLAIALARINELGWTRGGVRSPFTPSWFGIVLGSTVVVVLLGVLASAIFSMDNLRSVLAVFQPIVEDLRQAISYVLLLLVALIVLGGEYLSWLLRKLIGESTAESPPPIELELGEDLEQLDSEFFWRAVKLSRDAILVLLVLGVIVFVALVVQRRRRRRLRDRDVERESVWSSNAFLDDLNQMLNAWRQRLRDGAREGWARLTGTRYALDSIKRIYASMVFLARERGVSMGEAQTPHEFAEDLSQAWPGSREAIESLTAVYVDAHYGEVADTEEGLRRARQAWEHLRAMQPMERESVSAA